MIRKCVLVTIDTEADCAANWGIRLPFEFRGVSEGIGDRLMPLFEKYGVKPTFLCAHEVLRDDASARFLRSLPDCELGTHCHWDDPENAPLTHGTNRYYMQGRFSYEEELAQMKKLTELFVSQIGRNPLSFRAGRFGAGENTGKILQDLGYTTDSSLVPHVKHIYRGEEIFPDHSMCRESPYFVSESGDLKKPGSSGLLELPVTVRNIHRRFDPFGFRKKIDAWLRPSMSSHHAMFRIARKVLREPCPVMVMMFHNVEFVPGCSPYAADEAGVNLLLQRLEHFFVYCEKNEIGFMTMNGFYQAFKDMKNEIG